MFKVMDSFCCYCCVALELSCFFVGLLCNVKRNFCCCINEMVFFLPQVTFERVRVKLVTYCCSHIAV
jgi:hypothetical protein